ncbi:MAG: hypothetical protein PHE89_01390 [Alphaproteobacteria bacterium]|nr:hypothetical protein [Alphaproteobacteria bacterium]
MLKKILKILGIVLGILVIALGVLYFIVKDRIGLISAFFSQDRDAITFFVEEKDVDPNNLYPKLNLVSEYVMRKRNAIDYNFLTFLIKKGFSVNQGRNESFTPLFHAIFLHDQKLINFLIDNGADVNLLLNDKFKPLAVALQIRDCESSKLLVDRGATLSGDPQEKKLLANFKECEDNNWVSQQKRNKELLKLY